MEIVIIDDEVGSEKLLPRIEMLNEEGFSVRAFSDIGQALSYIANPSTYIDAVVLDLFMPPSFFSLDETQNGTTTGLEVFRRIRTLRPMLPVLFCTVLRRETIPKDILLSSRVDYISKPATITYIIDKLKALITK
jgi:CheY-like chemotaxis protein